MLSKVSWISPPISSGHDLVGGFVGHVVELHAGHRLKEFRGEMLAAADTRSSVIQLARIGFGMVDQLLARFLAGKVFETTSRFGTFANRLMGWKSFSTL